MLAKASKPQILCSSKPALGTQGSVHYKVHTQHYVHMTGSWCTVQCVLHRYTLNTMCTKLAVGTQSNVYYKLHNVSQVVMFESQMVVNCTWSCHWWQVRAQLEIVWSRYFDLGSRYFSPNYSPTTVQLPRPHSVLQNSPGQEQMRRRWWLLCFSLNKAQSASERCLQQSTSLRGVLPV